MREELEKLADRLTDIHISDHRPGLWAKMADVAEKLRSLAERLTAEQEEVMQIEPGNSGYTPPVAPPPSDVGGGDQVPLPEPHTLDFAPDAAPLYTADQLRAYADARVSAETVELRAKLAEAEASDAESVAMYQRARARAETAERERDEARAEAERQRKLDEIDRLTRELSKGPNHE